jgi:hypothetical protein
MIGAMARHRVQVLRAGGKTLRPIAAETGISLRSVKRIVGESSIAEPDDVVSAKARGVGRPSLAEPYRDRIADVLAAEPKLPTIEILADTLGATSEERFEDLGVAVDQRRLVRHPGTHDGLGLRLAVPA